MTTKFASFSFHQNSSRKSFELFLKVQLETFVNWRIGKYEPILPQSALENSHRFPSNSKGQIGILSFLQYFLFAWTRSLLCTMFFVFGRSPLPAFVFVFCFFGRSPLPAIENRLHLPVLRRILWRVAADVLRIKHQARQRLPQFETFLAKLSG